MAINLIYLGRRGGGLRLLRDLIRELEESKVSFSLIVNKDFDLTDLKDFNYLDRVFRLDLWDLFILYFFKIKTITDLLQNHKSNFLVVMSYPFDLGLQRAIFRSKGNRVTTIIHDGRRHPGDIWPTKYSLKLRVKNSHALCFLSDYVRSSYLKINVESFSVPLSTRVAFKPVIDVNESKYVLAIGRGKKYQGRDLLLKAWEMSHPVDLTLIIAGGKNRSLMSSGQLQDGSVMFIDGWLSENDLELLIRGAKFVILPYIEASQSGIVPISHGYGVPTLVTDVGGLPEQICNGINGMVSLPHVDSLAEKIESMSKTKFDFLPYSKLDEMVEKLLNSPSSEKLN